jgi:cell division protein ZapE
MSARMFDEADIASSLAARGIVPDARQRDASRVHSKPR